MKAGKHVAGIAAGHPATATAGLHALEDGGNAADAAVAATLVSCVAETVMTGIAGGGHAIWFEAGREAPELLDFFVSIPGLGTERRRASPPTPLEISFGEQPVPYEVGAATCAVPGTPAGLGELWRTAGSLSWGRLCEPAIAAAREGVRMPPAHAACLAMLESVMTMGEGARIYAPGGSLLGPGELLRQPGLARAFELLSEEGPDSFYGGTIARALLELTEERGGLLTRADLAAYRPLWREAVACEYAGTRVFTRGGLAGVAEALGRLPTLRGRSEAARALVLVETLSRRDGNGHTTNLAAVDPQGNACVVTTSLGLGSGDFIPGLDVHLNSMLGEAELLVRPLKPGERMESMMAPVVALDAGGLALAAGSAGGSRLRSALVQVISGILDERLSAAEAVERPRLHPVERLVHLEPGFPDEVDRALAAGGWDVRRWPARHHYFGGASVVGRAGAAGDPRRSGAALTL
jgi:gamma-glutamyltranspeptidase/glutathione hydrolase